MKNGKTAAGTQRWKCVHCGSSSVRRRPDVTRRGEFITFLNWLSGKHSQAEFTLTDTGRSLRRKSSWCWDIQPRIVPSQTIQHQVLVDGIWVGSWCLLIAVSDQLEVLAWQWCARESTAAWGALLCQLEAPAVVVSDGGLGLASAVRSFWPETRIQRCLFHVSMNMRQHLTRNPLTDAGKGLQGLTKSLMKVHTIEEAISWQQQLDQWWQTFGHLTAERTFKEHRWWFTHDRLRKAWQLLSKLTRNGTLFTYLEFGNMRTTSPLEGGINNGIRNILRAHRGMSEAHMKRAAEWFLYLRNHTVEDACQFLTTSTQEQSEPDGANDPDEETRQLYGRELSAEEGLWHRSGWAGRS